MSVRQWFALSLAAKCRILFGLAVLLIIATALFVPWYYMERLVDEMNLNETRHLAWIARAYLQPEQPDWDEQQDLLDRWWSANAEAMHLGPMAPLFVRFAAEDDTVRPVPPASRPSGDLWRFREASAKRFALRATQEFRKNESLSELPGIEIEDGRPAYFLAISVRAAVPGRARPVPVGMVLATLPLEQTSAQLWPSRIVIMTAGTLAGFLAILVFYLVTHKLILSPIHDLRSVAEQVSAGDLSVRADVSTGDEFEQLAAAINDMLRHLQKSQEELDTRLGELAETNVALYEANKLKSEFLANVSHELRTPLTSIIGFAELLRDAAREPEQIQTSRIARYAHNILTSGRNLLELINDLLDLAKMEAGKMELHRTHFALRDVCDAVIDFNRPFMEKKGLICDVRIAEDLLPMHSDAGRIQQILFNLVSNAIKFTPPGGTIGLEVHRLGEDRARIVVSDTGPGIAPHLQAAVFEKFRQLDSSATREHSGTGLGLPIARDLTQMLGGTIHLESEPGRGTTFVVILPAECPESAQVPLVSLT